MNNKSTDSRKATKSSRESQWVDTRRVIGGKAYHHKGHKPGNAIHVANRMIIIEFDSDFYITRHIKAKNWQKVAEKIVKNLPQPLHPAWLRKKGWDVPDACIEFAELIDREDSK